MYNGKENADDYGLNWLYYGFRMYDPDGTWFKEGHGVDPDIEVKENPESLAKGTDVQLDRAIKEVMESLKKNPKIHPDRPAKEDRSK